MTNDAPIIESITDLETFVHDSLLATGQSSFIVREHDRNVGVVTAQDVKQIDKAEWALTPVRRVMQRFDQLPAVAPEVSAKAALESMMRDNVMQLAVLSDGHIEGIVSRGSILHQLHNRMTLHT